MILSILTLNFNYLNLTCVIRVALLILLKTYELSQVNIKYINFKTHFWRVFTSAPPPFFYTEAITFIQGLHLGNTLIKLGGSFRQNIFVLPTFLMGNLQPVFGILWAIGDS